MSQAALFGLTGLLLAAAFLISLAGFTLRGFSRSRLDELCRRRGREARFGQILREHERALTAVELLVLLFTAAAVGLLVYYRPLWQTVPAGPLSWALVIAELLGAAFLFAAALLILPWTISRVAGESYLYAAWPLLRGILTLAKPYLWLVGQVDKFIHRLSGMREPEEGNGADIAEEILTVVGEGQREGLLESGARKMIERVMELQEEDTAAIMTPRTDMFCLQAETSLEEARRQLLEAGHTRVPVIGESSDDIVGILYAKDLLKYLDAANGQNVSLRQIVREPFYVPETTGIDTLLESMKRQHVHMAIVLDEYGGVAGLVTMEDVLEEIVGEIADEYDVDEEAGIYPVQPGIIEVEARVHIDDLNEQFQFGLPEDGDFDTIGGFVFTQLGRVPTPGDEFTWHQLRVKVLDADRRSIKRLRIEVDEPLAATAAEEG